MSRYMMLPARDRRPAKGGRGEGSHKGYGDDIKRQVGISEGKRRPHDEQQNKRCIEQARAAVQEEHDRQGKDGEGSGIRQQQDHQSDGHPGDIFPLHETTWQFSSQKYFAYGRCVRPRLVITSPLRASPAILRWQKEIFPDVWPLFSAVAIYPMMVWCALASCWNGACPLVLPPLCSM